MCDPDISPEDKSKYGDWSTIPLQHVPSWQRARVYVDYLSLELTRRVKVSGKWGGRGRVTGEPTHQYLEEEEDVVIDDDDDDDDDDGAACPQSLVVVVVVIVGGGDDDDDDDACLFLPLAPQSLLLVVVMMMMR